jgi:translocation and assembly module TamB
VKISGSATNLDSIHGAGTLSVKSAVVNRIDLGGIKVQGTFNPKIADLTGELHGPVGEASWRSHLVLGTEPEYKVELAVPSLKPNQIVQLDSSTPAEISFTGVVQGAGFDLKTMNTRASIDLLQSQLGAVAVKQGKILARISQGRIQLQQAQLEATGATLRAQGELGVDLDQPGRLDYRLDVTNLTPWLELVQRKGSGRLELAGNASGNLARLQTRGAMTLRELNMPEFAAQSGRILFALERTKDAPLPEGNINLDLANVRAGVQLARLQGTIKLPAPGTQTIAVSASARDQEGRNHKLVAEVENQASTLMVRAKELVLTLPDGSWLLTEPATITRAQDDFFIDKLILRNQNQTLSVSGRFSPSGAQALDAGIDRLSLATLHSFSPKAPDITGTFSAQAQIRGTAAAPVIEAKGEITDSKIAGQSYRGARAFTRYQNQNVAVDIRVEQDDTHSLDVRGTIPLALSWDRGWRAQPAGSMDVRARSAGLSLAFLNAFKPAAIQNINGEVAVDVVLRGTLNDPEPRGTFELRDGTFDAKALGIKLTAVSAQGSADARRISLSRLSARAGSGALDGSGVVSLRQFAPENIDLAVTARRWPALQTDQYRAIVNGNVKVAGPPSALRVAGAVEVVEGSIRPALAFLDRGTVPLKRDPTIVVVKHRGEAPAPAAANGKSIPEQNNLLQNLVLEVTVTIPNNLWVRHPNANVELTGKVTIVKKPESDVTLSGLLEIVRGWVGFQGRRFTLTEGRIQFTGGKPTDATLQLAAEYRVQGYLVNVIVSGTAEKPILTMQSQPVLEQSDILSLLLFGKPVADLTNTEKVSLEQNAIDITAGFAAAALGRAVSEAIGLQHLGLDLSDVSFTGGQVRFGRYVGPRTYLSISQDISGKYGREVALEYQLTPNWKLGSSTTTEGTSGFDVIWHKRY